MQEHDAPGRGVELLKTGEVEVRAAQQSDPARSECDDRQQASDIVERVNRGERRAEQEPQQQILRPAHDEEAPLQSFHHVVREDVRDADHDDEQHDRAELARAAALADPLAARAPPGSAEQPDQPDERTAATISFPAISAQL